METETCKQCKPETQRVTTGPIDDDYRARNLGTGRIILCPKHSGSINRRLVEALESAKKFITYARYELSTQTSPMRQFPSQGDADEILKRMDELLREAKEQHDH